MSRICPISSSVPRPLGAAYVPILLSEVEQEQTPSGNGDREVIVVGAGLCDDDGERTADASHFDIFAFNKSVFADVVNCALTSTSVNFEFCHVVQKLFIKDFNSHSFQNHFSDVFTLGLEKVYKNTGITCKPFDVFPKQ